MGNSAMRNNKLSLTDLPHDIFHNLIFPALSINDIAAVMMTCKAALGIVAQYDGYGSIEQCQVITSIPRMYHHITNLTTKFPRLLLNLYILQRQDLILNLCIDQFADNLLSLVCLGQCAETLTQSAPHLQKLTIKNHTPNLGKILDRCNNNYYIYPIILAPPISPALHAFPALTHLSLSKIIYNGVIRIHNNKTLQHIQINFVETLSPISINSLPNLTELYISTHSYEDTNICDIVKGDIGNSISIINTPNISFLTISNYVVKFDITQLTSLSKIVLKCVNYIPDNGGCELFQINFNEAFPYLMSLSISDSVSIPDPNTWPPQDVTLCDLSNLDNLHLKYISQLVRIGNLSNIKYVYIDECYKLVSIESASYIESMNIISCRDLNDEFRRHCVHRLQIEGPY